MKNIRFFDCSLSDLHIDYQELYILMGYGNHTPQPEIIKIIDKMLVELPEYCHPHYGYILQEAKIIDKEHLQIGQTFFNPGKIITSAMRKAEQIAVFTATLGSGFDEWNHKLRQKGDMLHPFIADALGSVLAEATASLLMQQLEKEVSGANLKITNNYSPGYCDWLLIEQKKIFSLFPDDIAGIRLTDSCLMLPVKSISGIIGIGKEVKKQLYGCDICKMTTCIKNKKQKK